LATVERAEVGVHEFSNEAVIDHNHGGVGCGKEIIPCPNGSEFNNKPLHLFTSGSVSCRLGWATDKDGRLLTPPKHFFNLNK